MTNLLIYIVTLSYFSYFIFIRINKNIYNITLDSTIDLYYDYLYKLYIISGFIIILFIITFLIKKIVIFFAKKAEKSYDLTKKKNPFFSLLHKLYYCYKKLDFISKTYDMVFDFIGPNYMKYFVIFAKYVLTFTNITNIGIIFLFIILPRLLIITIFFLEIHFGNLQYYFYSLFLLLIPLVLKFIIFILTDIGPRVLPEFQKIVSTVPEKTVELPTPFGLKKLTCFGYKLNSGYEDLNLDYILSYFYIPLARIEQHMRNIIKPLYSKINTVTIYMYYFLQFLGYFYIIHYIY